MICFSHTTEGALRLVGGARDNEGRVEVYHRGEWGTVCDDGWSLTDANVVCYQLRYGRATSAPGSATFGAGRGPIHYDDVACSGSETLLIDCFHNGIGRHDCNHSKDAGVVCHTIQGEMVFVLLFEFSCVVLRFVSVAFAQALNDKRHITMGKCTSAFQVAAIYHAYMYISLCISCSTLSLHYMSVTLLSWCTVYSV